MRHRLIAMFPIVEQIRSVPSRLMVRDLTAGITVAALLVPQGMAYAELAGLPAVNGLYASFVPILAYALFGSSRQLALGPTATVAVLTATIIEPLSHGARAWRSHWLQRLRCSLVASASSEACYAAGSS